MSHELYIIVQVLSFLRGGIFIFHSTKIFAFQFGKTRLAEQKKLDSVPQDADSESSEEEVPLEESSDDEERGDSNEVIERDVVLRPHLDKVPTALFCLSSV